MRDLIDHHEQEMMLDLTGQSRSVPEMGRQASAEASEGVSTGPAGQIHAGAGGGFQRVPDAIYDVMHGKSHTHIVTDDATADALMLAVRIYIHSLWDQAVALVAEDEPLPLVAGEAWAEGDEVYARRIGLGGSIGRYGWRWALDHDGQRLGLPRARLVPVEICR